MHSEDVDLIQFQKQVDQELRDIVHFDSLPPEAACSYSSDQEDQKTLAESVIAKPEIKQIICSTLGSTSEDIYDFSKALAPVLVTAHVTGAIVLPLNPLLYGWVVFLIFRVGVKLYCSNTADSPSSSGRS